MTIGSAREVDAFWQAIRKGKYAKVRATRSKPKPRPAAAATTPSAIKAHRAMIEHDCFGQNASRIRLVREAAREFDQWEARQKAEQSRTKAGRPKLKNIVIDRRKAA